MVVDQFLLDIESNLENFNLVKDSVLNRLLKDKIISEEQFNEYSEKWNIIILKPSWFKRWKDKFRKDCNNQYIIKYVKFED